LAPLKTLPQAQRPGVVQFTAAKFVGFLIQIAAKHRSGLALRSAFTRIRFVDSPITNQGTVATSLYPEVLAKPSSNC
jgi:hypothetical protein